MDRPRIRAVDIESAMMAFTILTWLAFAILGTGALIVFAAVLYEKWHPAEEGSDE